jgi:hypothetical protein
MLLKNSLRSFCTKAKIQFLGKRALIPSHKHASHQQHHITPQSTNSNQGQGTPQQLKPSFDKPKFSFNYRAPFSKEEIETINNGGPLKLADWNKIKLKNKKL